MKHLTPMNSSHLPLIQSRIAEAVATADERSKREQKILLAGLLADAFEACRFVPMRDR